MRRKKKKKKMMMMMTQRRGGRGVDDAMLAAMALRNASSSSRPPLKDAAGSASSGEEAICPRIFPRIFEMRRMSVYNRTIAALESLKPIHTAFIFYPFSRHLKMSKSVPFLGA